MSKRAIFGAIALGLAAALTGCQSGAGDDSSAKLGSAERPVKIGVVSSELQYDYLKKEAAAQGVSIEFVTFSDYFQANPALANGELDLNQFQHILFLAGHNLETGDHLVPLQATCVYPLAIYSRQFASLDDIPAGSKVAIPNDETNQARALRVLEANGLIKLADGASAYAATPLDIDKSGSKVEVTPVSAEQTPRSLDDPSTAAAVINNTFALDAGLDPDEALAADDPAAASSAPFVNVWVGREDNADDPAIAKVLEIARSQGWRDALAEQSKNSAAIVEPTREQLATSLAEVMEKLRADR